MSVDASQAVSRAIVEHAARWACNTLTEVVHNHGQRISTNAREQLRDIIWKLSQVRP